MQKEKQDLLASEKVSSEITTELRIDRTRVEHRRLNKAQNNENNKDATPRKAAALDKSEENHLIRLEGRRTAAKTRVNCLHRKVKIGVQRGRTSRKGSKSV